MWAGRGCAVLRRCGRNSRRSGASLGDALPAPLPQPRTYFTNLRDGDRSETPFVLKFGLSRSGLAAITKDVPDTGHHHLLVNRELPLDFTQPLPFNDQYRHFGKGQMEAVLDFAQGTYTLRLLLADHQHIPFLIYSQPMTITVTAKNDKLDAKSLGKPGVELLSPRHGEALSVPFRVQFHASGLNVSHTDITLSPAFEPRPQRFSSTLARG